MAEIRVRLDSSALAGRVRSRGASYERRTAASVRSRAFSDVHTAAPKPKPISKPAMTVPKPRRPKITPVPTLPHQSRSRVLKRQAIKRRPVIKRRRPASLRSNILMGMSVLLFAVAAGIGFTSFRTNQHVAAQVQRIADTNESSAGGPAEDPSVPSETKPSASLGAYKVAPTLPRTVSIPKLGVEARVLRLGVNAKNQLRSPASIYDAGWYDGSAKPGEAGAVLLDGHVSGPTRQGVFYGLKTLKKGDQIKVERGDGKVFSYRVVSLKQYAADKVDMAAAMTPVTTGKPGLNLITCSGDVDETGTGFTDRTVVFAEQE